MLLPVSIDGDEVHPCIYLNTVEEISRNNASVGWNIFVANSSALISPYLKLKTSETIFGPENAWVSWGPPNGTIATVEGTGYRISGNWDFASGCRQATWMGVHCMVKEKDGSTRLSQNGQPETRTMLFPVDNAHIIDTWNTIGLKGTSSDSYSIENLFVDESFTGLRESPDTNTEAGPLYSFTMQGIYAVGVAAVALGIARGMLDSFKELATVKTPRGLQTLSKNPNVQGGIAKSEAKIGSAKSYLSETLCNIYDAAQPKTPIDLSERALVRLASTNAIHNSIKVVDWVYHQAGVNSIFPDQPFERPFRDIHTLSQQIQARNSHYESVGKILLGISNRSFF
jgi:alkylation response protein AidB-like acyl-CoA dehydrogenase